MGWMMDSNVHVQQVATSIAANMEKSLPSETAG